MFVSLSAFSQNEGQKDTLKTNNISSIDSLAVDSIASDSMDIAPKKKKTTLDAVVDYQSKDSIIFTGAGIGYLYGDAKVNYTETELNAYYIRMNLDSSVVYAAGIIDTTGSKIGYPIFKDKGDEYNSESILYNFDTGKGYITNIITQQGEGYVTAGKTKRMPDGSFFMKDGRYTTCDEHDHPHFYLNMTEGKVRPKKNIVTGPVYLVLEDVPLPIAFPFGFFPFTSKYSSGVIMPSYGEDSQQGFYLRDGGYYFAISDNVDLALTGEIYTKGSWGLGGASTYAKRYKYRGSFSSDYLVTITGDKAAGDYQKRTNFSLRWSHSQDAKLNPNRSLTASIDFSTSGYNQNSLNSIYNAATRTTNTKTSSVSYGIRNMLDNKLNLNVTGRINQVSADSTINLLLPSLSLNTTTIYPFKRKNPIGNERWYEKVSFSYQGVMENSITTKEDKLLKSSLVKDWRNGMRHTIPVQASFNVFNNINITPSFGYEERWYLSKTKQSWDSTAYKAVKDTIYGFNRVYNYNFSVSAGTVLYGFYQPVKALFGDKVEMIRHTFKPSISFSMTPDFGNPRFGYWDSYSYVDSLTHQNVTKNYSYYDGYLYGAPGRGKSGNISFSIDNTLEMKVKSDRDSTGVRKISIFDKLSISSGYNLAADSLNWNNISVSLAVKITKSYNLNISANLDPYTYVADSRGNAIRVNTTQWEKNHIPGRLTSMNFSIPAISLNNNTFKKKKDKKESTTPTVDENINPPTDEDEQAMLQDQQAEKKQDKALDSDGYAKWDVPWSFNINYNISLARGTFNATKEEYDLRWMQSLSFGGNVNFSKNWSFNFNSSYNFDAKEFGYTSCSISRNLHCWGMSASFIPVGPYRSYSFSIRVNSSMLQDLKYEQRSSPYNSMSWY